MRRASPTPRKYTWRKKLLNQPLRRPRHDDLTAGHGWMKLRPHEHREGGRLAPLVRVDCYFPVLSNRLASGCQRLCSTTHFVCRWAKICQAKHITHRRTMYFSTRTPQELRDNQGNVRHVRLRYGRAGIPMRLGRDAIWRARRIAASLAEHSARQVSGSRPNHAVTSWNANGDERFSHRHRGQVPCHR